MKDNEMKTILNTFEKEFSQKTLEEINDELTKVLKIFKDKMTEKRLTLMRVARTPTGAFNPLIQSNKVEHYADQELLANVEKKWLEQPELEVMLLKIIFLRQKLRVKRLEKINKLEKELEPNLSYSEALKELQFLQLCDEICNSGRNALFLISKYSAMDGIGLPQAITALDDWKIKKEGLETFLKDNPNYKNRSEAKRDHLEPVEFRAARLALEGWLNHSTLDELNNEDGTKLSSEQLRTIQGKIETLFPLLNFPISKELKVQNRKVSF